MELVNEVLDITQIENGQLRINSQPVNIPKLLKALAKFKGEVIVDC